MNSVSYETLASTLGASCVVASTCYTRETMIRTVICSDLMSDVLTREGDNAILLTSLASVQIVRTADIVGCKAIILANGKKCDPAMVRMARELDITLLCSVRPLFELCVELGKRLLP